MAVAYRGRKGLALDGHEQDANHFGNGERSLQQGAGLPEEGRILKPGRRVDRGLPPHYVSGRGAQVNPESRFLKRTLSDAEVAGIDEPIQIADGTILMHEDAKQIVNAISSPDIPFEYSMNPYQGCEHGCIYCYARNTHEYWGLSAGLDFEQKIIVKDNAPELLEATLRSKGWKPKPIMLSGNTDCYQPAERKLALTRRMLQVLLKYLHPVAIITKNALVLRDLDILRQLAAQGLAQVSISITTLNEDLRRHLEPRTTTALQRLKAIQALSQAGVPVHAMIAPVIPGLNSQEIPAILEACARAGAVTASYSMVRLNGSVGAIFSDWIARTLPGQGSKVLGLIQQTHGGKLSDSRYGTRFGGEGPFAASIKELFRIHRRMHFGDQKMPAYNLDAFKVPPANGQLSLF